MNLNALLIAGEVQPAVSADPRTEVNFEKAEKNPDKSILNKSFPQVDGPTRGGLPVFQAHAGQRSPRHPPHGDAPREKEIVITHEWVSPSETYHNLIFQPVLLPKDD